METAFWGFEESVILVTRIGLKTMNASYAEDRPRDAQPCTFLAQLALNLFVPLAFSAPPTKACPLKLIEHTFRHPRSTAKYGKTSLQ